MHSIKNVQYVEIELCSEISLLPFSDHYIPYEDMPKTLVTKLTKKIFSCSYYVNSDILKLSET